MNLLYEMSVIFFTVKLSTSLFFNLNFVDDYFSSNRIPTV